MSRSASSAFFSSMFSDVSDCFTGEWEVVEGIGRVKVEHKESDSKSGKYYKSESFWVLTNTRQSSGLVTLDKMSITLTASTGSKPYVFIRIKKYS